MFLSRKSPWPSRWKDSEFLKEQWDEFKDFVGKDIAGKVLVLGDKAVIGLNWVFKDDKASKEQGLKWLRDNGYVAEFFDGINKQPERTGPLEE